VIFSVSESIHIYITSYATLCGEKTKNKKRVEIQHEIKPTSVCITKLSEYTWSGRGDVYDRARVRACTRREEYIKVCQLIKGRSARGRGVKTQGDGGVDGGGTSRKPAATNTSADMYIHGP